MEQAQKKLFIIVVIFIIVIVGAWLSLSNTPSGGEKGAVSELVANAPVFSDSERLGKETPSAAKQTEAAAYKEALLAKTRSGVSFSAEEKGAIGKLMLTEAHLYNFSDDERADIFSALRRQ